MNPSKYHRSTAANPIRVFATLRGCTTCPCKIGDVVQVDLPPNCLLEDPEPGETLTDQLARLSNDVDYDSLDPGIRETVRALREAGFETTDSGDGRTKDEDERTTGDMPQVVIETTPDDMRACAGRLLRWLERQLGVYAENIDDEQYQIEATYSPIDDVAHVMLIGFDDLMLRGKR